MKIQHKYLDGLYDHCTVVSLILNSVKKPNPHYKHHIRSAIREATNKVVGFVYSDNKMSAHFISKAAKKQLLKGMTEGLIAEHIVPVSIVNSKVLCLDEEKKEKGAEITTSEIVEIVKEWSVHAVITRQEDLKLKKARLTKSMPIGWDKIDKLARYNHMDVKIELITNEYTELKKATK